MTKRKPAAAKPRRPSTRKAAAAKGRRTRALTHQEPTLKEIPLGALEPVSVYPADDRLVDLDSLRATIEQSRFIMPIMVMPVGQSRYAVLDGGRRVAVARMLGLTSIQCLVYQGEDGVTPEIKFMRVQAAISEEQELDRRDQEDMDRRSFGLPPLTEAEHDVAAEEHEQADIEEQRAHSAIVDDEEK